MKLRPGVIVSMRKRSSWSQDELATAAGLNLRTVQRIENEGNAAMQSLKAIAAAFEVDIADLVPEENRMTRFEYKTVVLPFKFGIFKGGLPDIQTALNKEGAAGWQLKQMVIPTIADGRSDSVVAIFERAGAH